jgi:hypothetical protein
MFVQHFVFLMGTRLLELLIKARMFVILTAKSQVVTVSCEEKNTKYFQFSFSCKFKFSPLLILCWRYSWLKGGRGESAMRKFEVVEVHVTGRP